MTTYSGHRPDASSRDLARGILNGLQWWRTLKQLGETGPDLLSDAATLIRLFRSRHVSDLKLIAGLTAWFLVLGAAAVVCSKIDSTKSIGYNIEHITTPIVILLGIGGAVMGWVYRTASARLGIFDLFAYEITTLCRVGIIVDEARRCSARFTEAGEASNGETDGPKPTAGAPVAQVHVPYRFVSEENYFPVFDSNSRDLRVLEAGVVTNVTAFYTYMKMVRDYRRRITELDTIQKTKVVKEELQHAWLNVIYLLFLAYETARKSIDDLIEYEPTHGENTVVILLTEIEAYGFLQKYYANNKDNIRFRRLNLRLPEYRLIANDLYRKILCHPLGTPVDEKEWAKAAELLPELRKRCSDAGILMDADTAMC